MKSEEKEQIFFPDVEKVLEKTDELTALLCQTDDYRRYEKYLAILKEHQDVYQKLNEFRLKNIQLQIEDEDEQYYEKAEKLYTEYKDILMESVVMNFLTSEQRVCKMMRKVYERIASQMKLDVSYMD